MKKYLLFVVLLILSTFVHAQSFEYQGIKFSVLSAEEHTAAVESYQKLSGDIVIPSVAIYDKTEYSVTLIRRYAFRGCAKITSVTIPSSVSEIEQSIFDACHSLTSIIVEDGNCNFSSSDGVLFNYDKTTLIKCPLTKTEYVIPNSVSAIEAQAFRSCRQLTRVTIPESVTEIREWAFGLCASLKTINIPESVTEIQSRVFTDCTSLTTVGILGSVVKIGTDAFSYCQSLEAIDIPGSVTEIGANAFYNCQSLTVIDIPRSVTKIDRRAFAGCNNLISIIVEDGNPNYASENGVLFNKDITTIIQCPGAKTECFIPHTVTEIGGFAFEGCTNLTSITIPESVTKIGHKAFALCNNLNSIAIPCSITEISANTFEFCGIRSITIPYSVTKIGDNVFDNCWHLTSITIPCSVVEIGSHVFSDCYNLTSVVIPSSIKCLKNAFFSDCSNLTTIYNLNSVPQSVGEMAFSNVPGGATVYVPKGTAREYSAAVGWNCFSNFREMGSFEIVLSEQTLKLDAAGESAVLHATMTKDDDIIVVSEKWISSAPSVVTVDDFGFVRAVGVGDAVIYFVAVDYDGIPHAASCNVTVIDNSRVDNVVGDAETPVDVFNHHGVAVLRNAEATKIRNLPAGIYIVRQGSLAKKIAIR